MSRLVLPLPAIVLFFGACQAPPVSPEPERCTVPLASEAQREVLWNACLEVLRRHDFEIDSRDVRAGIITTMPLTSQNVIEFWRRDVVTGYDLFEANLHTISRRVEVRILDPAEHPAHQLEVAVYKQRYNAVEREVNNAAGGLRIFDPDVPSTLGLKYRPDRDTYWSPIGRDAALESYLLQSIIDRFNETVG